MAHFPVNHRLRPAYRALAALTGVYLGAFGVAGIARTHDRPLFAQTDLPWVLGLRTNLALAALFTVLGVLLIAAAVVGRNIDQLVNLAVGIGFVTLGLFELCVLRTGANVLAFSMVNCNVVFVLGLVLLTAGMYGRSAVHPAAAPPQV
jgi:hypothetical protein